MNKDIHGQFKIGARVKSKVFMAFNGNDVVRPGDVGTVRSVSRDYAWVDFRAGRITYEIMVEIPHLEPTGEVAPEKA